jgi:hypothetical protein
MKMKRLVLTLTLASLAALPSVGARGARARQCPSLSVSCPDTITGGMPVTFTVNVGEVPGDATLAFKWTVSAGTISSGQDTTSVTVDTTGVAGGQTLKATVEVGGLPESCPKSAACASALPQVIPHDKVDEYGAISFEDEKARLDNVAIELQNWPEGVGYIVAYGGRVSRRGEALRRAERAERYMIGVRNIPPRQVVTIDGGYREQLTVELRVRSKDWPPPAPYPTVDPKDVRFIQARPKHRARRR